MRPPRQEETSEAGGLSGSTLAASAYRALRAARRGARQEDLDFEDLDDAAQHAFVAVVAEIELQFHRSEEAGSEVSLSGLAEQAAARFVELAGGEAGYSPPAKDRFVFEALVRHVANGMDYDPDDHGDMASHEGSWEEWVRERLAAAGVS